MSDDADYISTRLVHFRNQHEPLTEKVIPYGFFLKKNDKTWGGICGQIFMGCLQIHDLWIHESLRRQGHGSGLLNHVEHYGKSQGATFVVVGSYEYYHALKFYLKHDYFVELERKGFKGNWSQFLLRKNFEVLF